MAFDELDDLNASIEFPDDGDEGGQHDPVEPGDGGDGGPAEPAEPGDPRSTPTEPKPGEPEPGARGGTDGGDGGTEPGEPEEPPEGAELNGIEQYLSQFGIEGGMIEFDDGEKVHFSELDDDKKAEVLTTLHSMVQPELEKAYGLDENEVAVVNYLRQNNLTFDELVNQIAAEVEQAYAMQYETQSVDIDQVDDDTVYKSYILQKNPEIKEEDLQKELDKAKELSTYTDFIKDLREDFKQAQQQMAYNQQAQTQQQMLEEIEQQRQEVVQAVAQMPDVDGLKINDGIKNNVLDLILNVDEDGDSLFMTEVFSDPQELFRAAFWYQNGADIIKAREDFWKKEKSAAYKRGLEDAKKGKRTFSTSTTDNRTTPYFGDSDEIISLDDLNI